MKNLISKEQYELKINSRFNEVLEQFSKKHKYNWLKGKYKDLLQTLYKNKSKKGDFELLSIELICKESSELIAGEVGYVIGKTYTSLSGFSSDEKKYANRGTLQLVLLAKYLQGHNFDFWNLGHPHMEYKKRLGCKVYTREEFLQRWIKSSMR